MINKGFFEARWMQVYRSIILKIQAKSEISFGMREKYKIKQEGEFTIIQNTSMGQKRPNKAIELAFNEKIIDHPIDQAEFNFTKINPKQIIFTFELDKLGEFLSCQDSISKNQKESVKRNHWLVINGTPINQFHSLFLPFIYQKYPQILNPKAITAALSLKKSLPDYKIAYNSQGGASSVNHLHFHIFDTTQLFKQKLFIQKTYGIYLDESANVGLRLSSFQKHGALYVKVDYSSIKAQSQKTAQVLYQLAKLAIIHQLPYHLILLDLNTAFVIYRGFATCHIRFGFLEYCEIIIAKEALEFQSINEKIVQRQYQELSLKQEQIATILHQIRAIKIGSQHYSSD